MTQYWRPEFSEVEFGARIEFRMAFAMRLMEHCAVITGEAKREDSRGRAYIQIMPPRDVVDRCFEMADYAVAEAERRGWIKPCGMTIEEAAAARGELERVLGEARYRKL